MTDVLPLLAWFAILPAAVLSWRWSRVVSLALAAVWLTTLGYLACKHVWPHAWACGRLEWQRWVSAAAGLAGIFTLAHHRSERHRFERIDAKAAAMAARLLAVPVGGPRTIPWGELSLRPEMLAALLVGSMAADGAAHLVHRGTGLWVLPGVQLLALVAMCLVSGWPRRS